MKSSTDELFQCMSMANSGVMRSAMSELSDE